jgi:hypothetical protein
LASHLLRQPWPLDSFPDIAGSDQRLRVMEDPMDHFVKLDRLPDGFDFPPELKDRIHFDAAAHKLIFRGYMSKDDFDRISQLTRDWSFRRSLEELFRLSVPDDDSQSGRVRGLMTSLTRLFSSKS